MHPKTQSLKKCFQEMGPNRILPLNRPKEKKILDITDIGTFRFFKKYNHWAASFQFLLCTQFNPGGGGA